MPEDKRVRHIGAWSVTSSRSKEFSYDKVNQDHQDTMAHCREVMRRRLKFDSDNPTDSAAPLDLEQDISSLYGIAVSNLSQLYRQRQIDKRSAIDTYDHIKRIGNLSETTIFALGMRKTTGEPHDRLTLIPSSTAADTMGRDYFTDTNQGYDFRAIVRGGEAAKLQVKTSEHQLEEDTYGDDILVLSLESIAGGFHNIPLLQYEMMQEIEGEATANTRLIDAAYGRLESTILNHIYKE